MKLTTEQKKILETGKPVRFTESETGLECVLIRADTYERTKALLEDFEPAQAYPAIDEAWREGWDAPGMSDYDRYEEHRQ